MISWIWLPWFDVVLYWYLWEYLEVSIKWPFDTGHQSKLITKDLLANNLDTHFQFSLWKHQKREQKFVSIFKSLFNHLITQSGTMQEKRFNLLVNTIPTHTKEYKDWNIFSSFYLFFNIKIVISINKSFSSINPLISWSYYWFRPLQKNNGL